MSKIYMAFDVESIGLHGDGFAVGFCVVDENGTELDHGLFTCNRDDADGPKEARGWIDEYVPSMVATHRNPEGIRHAFWNMWTSWKLKGAKLAAEVPWPVEANFLTECINDARRKTRGGMAESEREWDGPYPLIDIASVRLAVGKDPLAKEERKKGELPEHHPLADSRQSARLLCEALKS